MAAAIEKAYEVFGTVPRPRLIEGCPCCIDEKNVDVFLGKPLREITPDELSGYASSVFLTIGCLDDYLYLLPRILEISASDRNWHPCPEIVARSLRRGDVADWPEAQRKVIHEYFQAAFENQLAGADSDGRQLDSWLCALGTLFTDITPCLDRLTAHRQKLLEFYETHSESLPKGRLANAFWDDDAEDTAKQVIAWFASPQIMASIKTGYGL